MQNAARLQAEGAGSSVSAVQREYKQYKHTDDVV